MYRGMERRRRREAKGMEREEERKKERERRGDRRWAERRDNRSYLRCVEAACKHLLGV